MGQGEERSAAARFFVEHEELRDEDELLLMWSRQENIVSERAWRAFLEAEEGEGSIP
jgi:hypothetical protein